MIMGCSVQKKRAVLVAGIATFACIAVAVPVSSQDDPGIGTGYNSYGYPGMIDMPVATSRPDGELAFSVSHFAGQTRNTMTFQMLPRLSGSFRYSVLDNFTSGGTGTLYDRSFSLHYRIADETDLRPAFAIGLNDFLGTGVYSSEYLVATKTLGKSVRVSGGIGWGRLGGAGGFTNPLGILDDRFETRPSRDFGVGGEIEAAQWFRGDMAFFGGIEWQATDKLRLTAEYSSDDYPSEDPSAFRRDTQLNLGASYRITPTADLSLRYLYGSVIGVQLTTAVNPAIRPNQSGREPAPPPVLSRPPQSGAALSWAGTPGSIEAQADLRDRVADALEAQGLRLHGVSLATRHARVEIENNTYNQSAQAVGRTARVLSRLLPAQIDRFDITLVEAGLPVTELRIRRADMETLEHDLEGSWKSFARARILSPSDPVRPVPGRYPDFDWNVTPYLSPSFFDPDEPVRADFGAQLSMSYTPMPGVEISGILRQKVLGNLDEATRGSNSVLPRVRSEFSIYDREGEDAALTQLTAARYFKPGRDLYGRVTIGYLERMFGGLSSELLWKRNDSPFALGVEVNYVKQRDFDQRFGFRDYEVATGHASAYWDMGNGFHAQLDAGRYLAKDWGATLAVDREFGNGWKIGAFATLTDVPFDEFGEGSFDKGIRITIPLSWVTGEPNKRNFSTTIRPLTRDGGARLDAPGRLYDRVRPLQKPALQDGWGRFWR
ncbi:YjbH domain-containing protein [Roseovarius tibetensis]|uniref:YjbH domain-containing protein n=1 Tax=Roseovarius tibetensis TaxID=2685897 RepID=UPI003D7FC821